MKTLRSLFTAALMLALASTAAPARAADESPFKFEFHGFVVGTLYLQNQTFVNGQGSGLLGSAPRPAFELPQPGVATSKSGTFLGGDIRQTRPIFVITGPEALGAKPKAHLEFDLFGNANAGAYGLESPNLRLRQAYAELKWGNTTFDAGQHSAQLLLAQIPTTVAHITNPVAFGAGLLGWRTIGFRVAHAIPMDSLKLELAAEVSHPKWADTLSNTNCGITNPPAPAPAAPSEPGCALPGNFPNQISQAWASSMPQLVARVKADGKAGDFSWMGWVAGSYEKIDLKGFGSSVAPTGVTLQDGSVETGLTSYAGIVGGRFSYSPVALNLQAYTGRGTAPMFGSLAQFGDIGDFGYYVEVGVNITKQFSLWGITGACAVDEEDLQNWGNTAGTTLTVANTALRSDNQLFGGMLRYMDGGYAFAAEYYTYTTKWLTGTLAAPGPKESTSAYQFLVSAGYFF